MVLVGFVLAPFASGFSLFFILGGFSGIFGGRPVEITPRKRPEHPEKILRLVELLKAAHRSDIKAFNDAPSPSRISV